MLLRLYYLYEKSPEISELVDDLKEVYNLPNGGNLPLRARGSRLVTFKRKDLQRVVNKYGAYLNYLASLIDTRIITCLAMSLSPLKLIPSKF